MEPQLRNVRRVQVIPALVVILLGLAGFGLVLYSTVWGAPTTDDSYYYISAARNFISGAGFDLISHFAPALPLLLSSSGLFGIDPLTAARYINAGLFFLNICLAALIVWAMTGSRGFAVLAAVLTLTATSLITAHAWVMSEALYITFLLTGFLSYTLVYKKLDLSAPLLTGLFFGLAAATRYIGVSLLLAGGLFFLTEPGVKLRARLVRTTWFSLVGVMPLLLWVSRNLLSTGRPTSRTLAWHPMSEGLWIQVLNTLFRWVLPGRLVHDFELVLLWGIGLALLLWAGWRLVVKKRRVAVPEFHQRRSSPVWMIFLSVLSYWLVLVISRSVFDNYIPMDERLLSPLLMMSLLLLAAFLAGQWKTGGLAVRALVVIACLVYLVTNLTRSYETVQSYHQDGRGYASARDHISETYEYLRKRPEIPVYSNAFASIYFWTGRLTYPLPYRDAIPDMKDHMRRDGAYLVLFYSQSLDVFGLTEEELTSGLVEQIRLSESVIYRHP